MTEIKVTTYGLMFINSMLYEIQSRKEATSRTDI